MSRCVQAAPGRMRWHGRKRSSTTPWRDPRTNAVGIGRSRDSPVRSGTSRERSARSPRPSSLQPWLAPSGPPTAAHGSSPAGQRRGRLCFCCPLCTPRLSRKGTNRRHRRLPSPALCSAGMSSAPPVWVAAATGSAYAGDHFRWQPSSFKRIDILYNSSAAVAPGDHLPKKLATRGASAFGRTRAQVHRLGLCFSLRRPRRHGRRNSGD